MFTVAGEDHDVGFEKHLRDAGLESVVPVRTFVGARSRPCRGFITAIISRDREEQGYGTACRQVDGDWQVVADNFQASCSPRDVAGCAGVVPG